MSKLQCANSRVVVLTAALATLFAVVVYGQQPTIRVEPVSELCLGCICEAVSNCNRSLTCNGEVCGIFRITWAYWADSGKPTLTYDDPNDPGAYPRCVNDPVCAAKSVTNYMARFAQDCNGDNVVNCYDYAAIHRLGGYGCQAALDVPYSTKFHNCQTQVQSLGGTHNSNIEFI